MERCDPCRPARHPVRGLRGSRWRARVDDRGAGGRQPRHGGARPRLAGAVLSLRPAHSSRSAARSRSSCDIKLNSARSTWIARTDSNQRESRATSTRSDGASALYSRGRRKESQEQALPSDDPLNVTSAPHRLKWPHSTNRQKSNAHLAKSSHSGIPFNLVADFIAEHREFDDDLPISRRRPF